MNDNYHEFISTFIELEDERLQYLQKKYSSIIRNPEYVSNHYQGKFLEFISQIIAPENILEIGTYIGYSTFYLAKGLKGNGKLHSVEKDTTLKPIIDDGKRITDNQDKIIIHYGDLFKIYDSIQTTFDLVFIDGNKNEYIDYFNKIIDDVNSGGYILVDNVFWEGRALEPINQNDDSETIGVKTLTFLLITFPALTKYLFQLEMDCC